MTEPIPPDRVPAVLANIARDLAVTPRRQRWFGPWWWPIKAMLIRAGHVPEVPWLAGRYYDGDAIATIPADAGPGQVLAEGLAHYWRAGRLGEDGEWCDAPNGDRVRCADPDCDA